MVPMKEMFASLWATFGDLLPTILLAIGLLVLFCIGARIVRAPVRRGLGVLKVDFRVAEGTGKSVSPQTIFAAVTYYGVLVLGVVAALDVLQLRPVSETLQSMLDEAFAFLPNLLAGCVLILAAWLVATFMRNLSRKAMESPRFDERRSEEAGVRPISQSLAQRICGVTLLLFLPAILGAFQLHDLLGPVQGMMDELLAMLPNIAAALAIGFAGWFLASLERNIVVNLLNASRAERALSGLALPTHVSAEKIVGIVVCVLLLVPAVIAALDALRIEAISKPATDMLGMLLNAVPNILAAGIILTVAWFVARFVSGVLDGLPERMGIASILPERSKPAPFVGRAVVLFLMLFVPVEAASRLGFTQFADIVETFILFGSQVLLGVTIIRIGFWLSNLAHAAIQRVGGANAGVLAGVARFAIVGVALAMGFNAMEIADQVVNVAFGPTLGAVAVAIALMFGLGGRDAAGRQTEHSFRKLHGESN